MISPKQVSVNANWYIWQLVDSAFPTGGFAHSSGLETARQARQVRSSEDLQEFARVATEQAIETALPYVRSVYAEPERLWEIDAHCDAFLAGPVVNRASRSQGSGLLMAASAAFPDAQIPEIQRQARRAQHAIHLAPMYGLILRYLDIPLDETERTFLFVSIRSLLSAAVRLNIVGPLEAQRLQVALSRHAEQMLDRPRPLSYLQVAQTAPTLDVLQAMHDRLYSRLFQS